MSEPAFWRSPDSDSDPIVPAPAEPAPGRGSTAASRYAGVPAGSGASARGPARVAPDAGQTVKPRGDEPFDAGTFASSFAPEAAAVKGHTTPAMFFHPDPKAPTTHVQERITHVVLNIPDDYGKGLDLLRAKYFPINDRFPLRLEGKLGEDREREILGQIRSAAYALMQAAYEISLLYSLPHTSAKQNAEYEQHRLTLDVVQQYMRQRSVEYFAFLQNHENLAKYVPSGDRDTVDINRGAMYGVMHFAETVLGTSVEVDMTSAAGAKPDKRAQALARDWQRDMPRLLRLFRRQLVLDRSLLDSTKVALEQKKELPGFYVKDMLERVKTLEQRLLVLIATAAVQVAPVPGDLNELFTTYLDWRREHWQLEADSNNESASSRIQAEEITRDVLSWGTFIAEVATSVFLGPWTGRAVGLVLAGANAYHLGDDVTEAVVGDLVSKTIGVAMKNPMETIIGKLGARYPRALSTAFRKTVAGEFGTRLVRDVGKRTFVAMNRGKGIDRAVGEAFEKTFTIANITAIAIKSVAKGKFPDKEPKTGSTSTSK